MNIYFQSPPEITLATNIFINIPTVLQYDDTPLIEIVKEHEGVTIQIHLYHSDGTYLAKARGNRIYPAREGGKPDIEIKNTLEKVICRLENKIFFEISQGTGESFKIDAELFTPDGYMVKCSDWSKPELFNPTGCAVPVGGVSVSDCIFRNCPIGIWLHRNGSCIIG
jgi:hypothetical protein